MSCDLDVRNCITIENAIFKLGSYAIDTKLSLDENIDDFGPEHIMVKIQSDRLNDIAIISKDLQKISDKCGCR